MIYYGLTALLSASIREICIICNPGDLQGYNALIGDGSDLGAKITYIVQNKPEGVPQAFVLADEFILDDNVALILGDNVFVDSGDIRRSVENFDGGAHIFAARVKQPQNYGVVEFDSRLKPLSIVEKPTFTKSRFAIPGFYIFDHHCIKLSRGLKKSSRGEFEIIDLLKCYMAEERLFISLFSRGTGWIDAGTIKNHAVVSRYIEAMQQMHGVMFGSPHEAAFIRGFITRKQLQDFIARIGESDYQKYLKDLVDTEMEFLIEERAQ